MSLVNHASSLTEALLSASSVGMETPEKMSWLNHILALRSAVGLSFRSTIIAEGAVKKEI